MEAGRTIEMRLFSVSNRMKQVCLGLYFVLGLSLCLGWAQVPEKASPRVDVVIGGDAPALERFAASELCDYLAKLYRVDAFPDRHLSSSPSAIFLIGNPETNALVRQVSEAKPFPKVSDQGIVLRRTVLDGRPALIVGGGSPRATLWAVYELVERWGVRYMADRDILPEHMAPFEVPDLDVVMEPVFRIRAHPSIQDYASSGESWGMADFRPLIAQLAKMKFSRLNIFAFGYQPFLDWQYGGIQRSSAHLCTTNTFRLHRTWLAAIFSGTARSFGIPICPTKRTTSNWCRRASGKCAA
jgi:hypothetical protein